MTFSMWAAHVSEWLGVFAITLILRRQARRVDFRYPRREGFVAMALFVLALLSGFFLSSAGLDKVAGLNPSVASMLPHVMTALLALALCGLALLLRGQPLRSAGWEKQLLRPALYTGVALGFLTIFLRFKIYDLIDGIAPDEWAALLAWLVICLCEEIFFRGYIQLRFSSWMGNRWGWLAVAVLYAIWHLPRLLITPASLLPGLLFALCQGLILGWLVRRSGNVLAAAFYRTISEWLTYL